MRSRRTLVALCLGLLLTSPPRPASAQGTPASDAAAAMERLGALLGNWEGSGWMVMGPSGRHDFTIRETARTAAGGSVVIIEGLGHERLADGGRRVVHEAFAVVSWDPEAGVYRMRAYRAGGGEVEDEPDVGAQGLVWGFRDPRAGEVRFTVTLADGTWHEVGEFSPDGTTWTRFLEMRLTRSGDPAGG